MRIPSSLVTTLLRSTTRAGTIAFAAAALSLAAAAGASAAEVPAADQASPSPAPPAGAQNPGPPNSPGTTQGTTGGPPSVPARSVSKPAALSHLPIIDFVATFTQPGYYGSSANLKGYDPVDLGGTVRIPITRTVSAFFDRITEGTLHQPLECVTTATGARLCPNDTRDVVLQYHVTETFKRFAVDEGVSFRHRIWSSGANGVSAVPFPYSVSSTEHHFAYLGVFYTTPPIKELLRSTFIFGITGEAQNVDHHVGTLCTASLVAAGKYGCTTPGTVGYIDERPGTDRYYESTQSVSMIVPVDTKHGTSLLLNERWGALNFYENAPFPYRWNSALVYQLSKRFSPGLTIALRHQDHHAIPQGAPFVFPNAIHVGSWDVIGTFHLDTNSWLLH